MTFSTDDGPITPRLVIQYNTEAGDFKQIVIEDGSEIAEAHKLGKYFDLIEKFANNAELVNVLSDSRANETVQFSNPENVAEDVSTGSTTEDKK